jgi:hypothetical protein
MQPSTQTTQPETKRFQCRHVRTSGRRCRSFSLRGQHFCYYHNSTRRPAPRGQAEAIAAGYPVEPVFQIQSIEDKPAIQAALLEVMNRIAANTIDNKRAGMLLYGLQIASNNLPREPRAAVRDRDREDASPEDDPIVDDVTFDPDYGPLAHVAEYIEPEPAPGKDQPSNMVVHLLQQLNLEKDCYTREQGNLLLEEQIKQKLSRY